MLTSVKNFLANQARQPSGWFGRTIAPKVFNKENKAMEQFGLEAMNLQSNDQVLEIGFGNGHLIGEMLPQLKDGKAYGVDLSEDMVDLALKLNKEWVDQGKLELTQGSVEALPYEDETFDKIFTANTIYFWPQPGQNLQEIKRVLKPGSLFACGLRLKDQMQATDSSFKNSVVKRNRNIFEHLYEADEIQQLFEKAGFKQVKLHQKEENGENVHVISGVK